MQLVGYQSPPEITYQSNCFNRQMHGNFSDLVLTIDNVDAQLHLPDKIPVPFSQRRQCAQILNSNLYIAQLLIGSHSMYIVVPTVSSPMLPGLCLFPLILRRPPIYPRPIPPMPLIRTLSYPKWEQQITCNLLQDAQLSLPQNVHFILAILYLNMYIV